mmetsp:Transcript_30455/g.74140  ORF Transcript_30455/g.74140 Transcript_30455/m.74140 type:complete len:225 (+) Transcript_30455:1229-1903(+)
MVNHTDGGTDILRYSPEGSRTTVDVCLMPGQGGQIKPNFRRVHWTWYRNISEVYHEKADERYWLFMDRRGRRHQDEIQQGDMHPDWEAELRRRAASELPLWLSQLINSTRSPGAFNVKYRISHEAQYEGQVILVGEALAIPGPHRWSGPALAAIQAKELVKAISYSGSFESLQLNLRIWAIKMRKRATRDHIVSEFDLLKHQHTDSPRNLKPEIVEQPRCEIEN